jgi:hypothetical protein
MAKTIAKAKAAPNEDLIDDESEDGSDAEDEFKFDEEDDVQTFDDGTEDDSIIHSDEIMSMCEEKINSCEDQELKDFFVGIKKFYDGASCVEAKKKIALQVNNKVFKLIINNELGE